MNLINKKNLIIPKHIAIIMDGNNRWTKKRGLRSFQGHEIGIKSIESTIKSAKHLGIKYLTLFSFSSENWSRPKNEVTFLMKLLRRYLSDRINDLLKNDIQIKMIGDKSKLPLDISKKIQNYENLTKKNKSLTVIFALSYGSRNEIIYAVNKIKNEYSIKKKINEKIFTKYLNTVDIPDPDLLIRTSGEKRLSNFLLWQIAYTELVFLNVLWPDFRKRHLVNAINQYSKRKRTYGSRIK